MVDLESGDTVDRRGYTAALCSTTLVLHQITPPAATQDELWQRSEAAWSAIPKYLIRSLFESMSRRVAAVISNNGSYSGC
ncbi:hypothetical protein TNCV_4756931 [Trichonephila clavipes]|nr:hypothetical protein TNCV_4756931 [Trichonephila clavipes]